MSPRANSGVFGPDASRFVARPGPRVGSPGAGAPIYRLLVAAFSSKSDRKNARSFPMTR